MTPIYLEPDEEITSVIEKLSATSGSQLALVVPKNGTLFQSLVNLKLLAREAKSLGKTVAIVSNNKVGARLAKQVGLNTFASVGALPSAPSPKASNPVPVPQEKPLNDVIIDGVLVHQYDPNRPASATAETSPIEPIPVVEAVSQDSEEIEPVSPPVEPDEPLEAAESLPAVPVVANAPSEKAAVELPAVISRGGRLTSSSSEPWRIPWKALAIAAGCVVFLLIAAFFLLPKATVTITLPAEQVAATFPLTVQAQAGDESTLVGNLVESQQSTSLTVTSTGKKDIGAKASGTITITNKYRDSSGAGKDQTFPAGTKATDTKSKKVFTLNSAVTVSRVTFNSLNGQPIYDSKSVKVTATEPGESYNVAPGSFSLAGALADTTVESSEAFTGGLTKQVTVLSQEDFDKALLQAKTEAETKAKAELQEKAKSLLILPEAIWQSVITQKADHAVGDQTDTSSLQLSTNYATFAIDQAKIEEKLRAALSKDITASQELVIPEGKGAVPLFKGVSEDKARLSLEISGQGYKVQKIDKQAIASDVHNRSVASAEALLKEKYLAQEVAVAIRPSWFLRRLPFLKGAIEVEYGFGQAETETSVTP